MHKPVHIFRTIPPYLCEDLVNKFEGMKKRVFNSILGCCPQDDKLNKVYSFVCLPTASGGLGLSHTKDVSVAAYVASLIATVQSRTSYGIALGVSIKELAAATDRVVWDLPEHVHTGAFLHGLVQLQINESITEAVKECFEMRYGAGISSCKFMPQTEGGGCVSIQWSVRIN
jgi:hypothetical protein